MGVRPGVRTAKPIHEHWRLSAPFIRCPGIHPVNDLHELADLEALSGKPGCEFVNLVIRQTVKVTHPVEARQVVHNSALLWCGEWVRTRRGGARESFRGR